MRWLNLDTIDNPNNHTCLLSRLSWPKTVKWTTLKKSDESLLLFDFESLFEFLIVFQTLSKSQTNLHWVKTYYRTQVYLLWFDLWVCVSRHLVGTSLMKIPTQSKIVIQHCTHSLNKSSFHLSNSDLKSICALDRICFWHIANRLPIVEQPSSSR